VILTIQQKGYGLPHESLSAVNQLHHIFNKTNQLLAILSESGANLIDLKNYSGSPAAEA
jgi:hypothetical protein